MHPRLLASTAVDLAHKAAVGLARHGHQPGATLTTLIEREMGRASLHWVSAPPRDAEQLDRNRVTEDGAEAIALALVHEAQGWVVRRRLQRGDFADWLLEDSEDRLVALEVSGIGDGVDPGRLRDKLEQVGRSTVASHKAACVVELAPPRAIVETA